jgi:hypothetical protein
MVLVGEGSDLLDVVRSSDTPCRSGATSIPRRAACGLPALSASAGDIWKRRSWPAGVVPVGRLPPVSVLPRSGG